MQQDLQPVAEYRRPRPDKCSEKVQGTIVPISREQVFVLVQGNCPPSQNVEYPGQCLLATDQRLFAMANSLPPGANNFVNDQENSLLLKGVKIYRYKSKETRHWNGDVQWAPLIQIGQGSLRACDPDEVVPAYVPSVTGRTEPLPNVWVRLWAKQVTFMGDGKKETMAADIRSAEAYFEGAI